LTQKFLGRGLLIAALSVALATPARADQYQTGHSQAVAAAVIAVAAVAVVVIVLVRHRHKPKGKTIAGCVRSGASGMRVTSEKDQRTYTLSGNTAGLKQGSRVTLEGNPSGAGNALIFDVQTIGRDLGACPQ